MFLSKDAAEFEFLTAVITMITLFWNLESGSSVELHRRFGGSCFLHFHGIGLSQEIYQQECLLVFWFLLVIFLDTEDGGSEFLWNVSEIITT
jgi:hypothetical protein